MPPILNQPGTDSMTPRAAQTLYRVLALPVQYSASAEMSGISRHGVPCVASKQCVLALPYVVYGLMIPGPCWVGELPPGEYHHDDPCTVSRGEVTSEAALQVATGPDPMHPG